MNPELFAAMVAGIFFLWYAAKMQNERGIALRELRELKEKLAKLEAQSIGGDS
jgi:hypothetical protein